MWKHCLAIILLAISLCCSKNIVDSSPVPEPSPTPVWGQPSAVPFAGGILQMGANHAVISWPDLPRVIYGGSESLVLRRRQVFVLGDKKNIVSFSTFMGWDRGDIGEAHILIFDANGVPIYMRSDHRQNGYDINYNAYDLKPVPVPTSTRSLTVDLLVRCTGENLNPTAFARNNPLSVFFEANVLVYFQ